MSAAWVIFALTYVLIASRRLRWLPVGRPGGAFLGAVAMVAAGVLSPEASYAALDHDTLALLLGMMLLSVYLERAGVFEVAGQAALRLGRRPLPMLLGLVWVSGGMSALLVNDTVCLFLTPWVVSLCRRTGWPMGPFLIGLATSANLGSAATLVGNPQNMLIGSMSGVSFGRFLAGAGLAAGAGLLVNCALLWAFYGRQLQAAPAEGAGVAEEPEAEASPLVGWRRWWTLAALAGVVAAFFAGAHLGYAALCGAAAVMVVDGRDAQEALRRVDWSLLLFFAGLFVVVGGLESTGVVEVAWEALAPHIQLGEAGGLAWFVGAMVAGSNVVSNVPMVLLTGPHLAELGEAELGWVLLGFVTTVAGNLTLVGSVANLIVAEGARARYALGFWEYARFGVVSTLLTLAVGVPLVVWAMG